MSHNLFVTTRTRRLYHTLRRPQRQEWAIELGSNAETRRDADLWGAKPRRLEIVTRQ